MKKVKAERGTLGRAKTVLVFGDGPEAKAVITLLVAQWSGQWSIDRLRFRGPLRFASETEAHIAAVILPAIDRLCKLLGLEAGGFDLSGVNLGAASCQDIGIDVSGFSADLAVFLALLSARLQIPLTQDAVCTGHIASVDGEVRMVRNLPAKLEAAKGDPSVKRFFHPSLDADASVAVLVGAEFDRIQAALANKGGLNTIAVRDVSELLESVVTEDAVVFAALAGSYFGRRFTQPVPDEPVGRAARFLGAAMERRYFDVLASHLIAGDVSAVVRLLEAWTGFWVRHQRYPHGFGQRLRRLILSVPTSIRVRKLNTQLLSVQSCINLSQCAAGQDAEDVLDLYRVVTGGTANPPGNQPARKQPPKPGRKGRSSTLDIVLAEIEQEHLTAVICLPIDTARASFLLDSVTAENPVQALEIITSFYIHLQRYTDRSAGSPTFEEAGPEAQLLLERAFARRGGTAAALAEAQSGIEGGLRFVLDQMTEQFKRECQEKHVLHVLATAVNPLDWEAKVKFIKELFHRCRALLPAELTSEPPERFARDYERIVRLYVNALAEMKQVLRAL